MAQLPLAIYTQAQVRAVDRSAIDHCGIPSYTLMTRAGNSAFVSLRDCWPNATRIVVLCGPGNNGGDGYLLAKAAREQGMHVVVVALTDIEKLQGDARRAWTDYRAAGGTTEAWRREVLNGVDVVVDAIFGVGLTRPIEGEIAECIQALNESNVSIFSLDIPSGLAADSGHVLGCAVHATRTLSFIGLKLGFYLGVGPDYTGTLSNDSLEIPQRVYDHLSPAAVRIDEGIVSRALPQRRRTAHKGRHGHVLVIGGGPGMPGATRLAGEAALRVGSGVVTVATCPQNVASIATNRPELICRAVQQGADLRALLERADVVAVGPGLGQDAWAHTMLTALEACDKPMVVDADALNLLAKQPRRNSRWVLTPHPGEAGRLIGQSASEIQSDRLLAAREIVTRYGGVVVLKGAGSLVLDETDLPQICDRGNPGMGTPGMGDVLTGVIVGLLAQGLTPTDAARAGVFIHAAAGDLAAKQGERGLIASDLFEYLRACVNQSA